MKTHIPALDKKQQTPDPADIAIRAYFRYVDRGSTDGFDVLDWLVSEESLRTGNAPIGSRSAYDM